ncbi:aldo/keto reductase [Massiliimalia massiliensis]|uniref:aldo/keto reductase n=1 Tax=Massiliimalia massiliensis TaxID=1852384 RepID=UPI0009855EED|nr:aldo/keto reductase [Massiliimalia massiliensis]
MRTFQIQNERDALEVSRVILGTTYLGNMDDHAEGYRQMNRYFELGGRCLDTARIYSNLAPEDRYPSEKVIGEWLRRTGVRKQLVLSTKGGHPPYGQMEAGRLGRKDLWYDLEQSLDALQTDYIDLYWLHRDHLSTSVEEIVDTLNEFADKGLVRCFGVSNWTTERLLEANTYAKRAGKLGFSASQIQWSLAACTPQTWGDDTLVCMTDQIRADYLRHHVPVMAYNAQAKGFFSKLAKMKEEELPAKIRQRFLSPENREMNLERFNRLMELSRQYHVSPAVIAVAYLTSQQLETGAIVGCSSIAQLEDSMSAQDFVLSQEEVNWLEEK